MIRIKGKWNVVAEKGTRSAERILMNLRNLRIERGMTQEAVAQSCGISRQRVTNYEIGIREPNLDTLKKLATALDVTVDELLRDEDDERRVSANA
jgi:transcriptional regulator with XRE-family HTH domain